MKPLTVEQACRMTGGVLASGDPGALVTSVSTDTRTLRSGALYVALSGERFDGHDFLGKAVDAGAVAVMVSRDTGEAASAAAVIRVDDTLAALQRLAAAYRDLLGTRGVGITGSSGKTSTKDMVAAVLGTRFRVRATSGNLNNHIGLPLTLLSMEPDDEIGVWEMGMNHPGEIAVLAAIARPEVGLVTNVGTAHIEFMGSREAIAHEKGSLPAAIGPDGCAVLLAGDDFTPQIRERCRARVVTAGIDAGDVIAQDVRAVEGGSRFRLRLPSGAAEVELPVPGRHMVANAVLAAAVGDWFGLSADEIARGLGALNLTRGRLQLVDMRGVRFIDDTYNANPESMRAALDVLGETPASGKRIAVLGRMAELGEASEAAHRDVGRHAAASGRIDRLVVVGEEAVPLAEAARAAGLEAVETASDCAAAARILRETTVAGDLVLVKGSRSAGMERVISEFGQP